MSYRSSFSTSYGGRASPAAHRLSTQDRSFSDLFEYVDPSDVGTRGYNEPTSSTHFEDETAPDVLNIKYMGEQFRLQFPPYSISESGVTVQEVRRRVAEGLKQDPRRIRLQYKDKELRYDPYSVKRYGLKQNSEIYVVLTQSFNDYGGGDNNQSSSEESGSGSSLRPPAETRRPRGLSTVRHRVEYVQQPSASSDYLHPNGSAHHASNGDRRRSRSPAQRHSYPAPTETSSSLPRPSSTPAPRKPSADPNSPMGKVQALHILFYDKWQLESQDFLRSPPSDKSQREKESRRLSESIMKHIVEAADSIELQDDQTARSERKKVLVDAQDLMKRLDAVGQQSK